MFPKSSICGETKSINRHDEFKTFGIEPKLRDDRNVDDEGSAKNLLICIPPSAAKLYDEELNESVRLWAGPASGGKLVFTSSIGIYGDSNGNTVMHTLVINDGLSMFHYAYNHMKKKGSLDVKNNQGLTPLNLAAKIGKEHMFELIIDLRKTV